jgi:uncharacterized protein YbgA (DUF1722 family)/uncharacterized protein YbbK (DUF523 family)
MEASMKKFAKPIIFISSCLEHDHCRYDGGTIHSDAVKKLLPFIEEVRVCPELSIGLGAPREALRLVQTDKTKVQLLSSLNGINHTEKMNDFTFNYLDKLKEKELDGFILKAKSPSCGVKNVKVYKGVGKSHVLRADSSGFFGQAVVDSFNMPIETERRLSNYNIRDNFYTQIFVLAEYRTIRKNKKYKDLVDFHARNKYLFMTHNEILLRELGQIVANNKKLNVNEVFALYHETLLKILDVIPTQKKRINVLTHIYGYFKNDVNSNEKEYYFDTLNEYLNNQKTFASVLTILESWTIRFQKEYLLNQSIYRPYPLELLTLMDSGKNLE